MLWNWEKEELGGRGGVEFVEEERGVVGRRRTSSICDKPGKVGTMLWLVRRNGDLCNDVALWVP